MQGAQPLRRASSSAHGPLVHSHPNTRANEAAALTLPRHPRGALCNVEVWEVEGGALGGRGLGPAGNRTSSEEGARGDTAPVGAHLEAREQRAPRDAPRRRAQQQRLRRRGREPPSRARLHLLRAAACGVNAPRTGALGASDSSGRHTPRGGAAAAARAGMRTCTAPKTSAGHPRCGASALAARASGASASSNPLPLPPGMAPRVTPPPPPPPPPCAGARRGGGRRAIGDPPPACGPPQESRCGACAAAALGRRSARDVCGRAGTRARVARESRSSAPLTRASEGACGARAAS